MILLWTLNIPVLNNLQNTSWYLHQLFSVSKCLKNEKLRFKITDCKLLSTTVLHCATYKIQTELDRDIHKFNKLTSVFHTFVLYGDHEFCHNIVKVAVELRGDSRMDPLTTSTMVWRNLLSITGKTHDKLTYICFFFENKLSVKLSALARWASHKL